ncbi:MAG: DUF1559 domain-containing protein [Fuerstiella sp.]|nr:DUF1559 domain-containing protein [Fuerstiella sp.]MCP4506222.1 DUF1559 domain-containing protein [Fuerstiella sp.]
MQSTPNQRNHIVHFSSQQAGGVQFLLCDGSVQCLSENIDYGLFRNLGKRSDGNVIGEFQAEMGSGDGQHSDRLHYPCRCASDQADSPKMLKSTSQCKARTLCSSRSEPVARCSIGFEETAGSPARSQHCIPPLGTSERKPRHDRQYGVKWLQLVRWGHLHLCSST